MNSKDMRIAVQPQKQHGSVAIEFRLCDNNLEIMLVLCLSAMFYLSDS